MPLIVPPAGISATGQLEFYWIQPSGIERSLNRSTSPKVFVPKGTAGGGTVTYEIEDVKFPFFPGSAIQHIRTNPRSLDLPLLVHAEDLDDLLTTIEDVHDWFFTGDEENVTPGTFKVIRPDGSVRHLKCFCTKGLEGDMSEGGPGWNKYVISLYAPDGHPTDPTDTLVTKTMAQAASFAVINQGRINAYPVWKLFGPFTSFTLTNTTYDPDQVLTFNSTIVAGEYIIVDTRPSDKRTTISVYDQAGTSRIFAVSPISKYWQLLPGNNAITVSFAGGNGATTSVELRYLARYRSLLR